MNAPDSMFFSGQCLRSHKPCTILFLILLLVATGSRARAQSRPEPTEHWLDYYGLESWQVVFDQDFDGFSSREEFDLGTDPLDSTSRPIQIVPVESAVQVHLENSAGLQYELQAATDLSAPWQTVSGLPLGGIPVVLDYDLTDTMRFFRYGAPPHTNSDGDCLLDYEELVLFGTDPLKTDTDGDGVSDCDEIKVYGTDPLVAPVGFGHM